VTLPYRAGQILGWISTAPSGAVTTQLNAAANWLAFSFVPDQNRTLSAVRAFVSAVAGSLASTDITCSLYDSTGTVGVPGSAIESKLPAGAISGAGWVDFTGFTTALTAGQMYWVVFKNVNAVPATNNVTFRFVSTVGPYALTGDTVNRFGWHVGTSVNSGGAWTATPARSGVRIAYSGGLYDGLPVSNSGNAGVGDGVYSTRESGIKFTSPANVILNVAGIALYVGSKVASPTGNMQFGLWTGSPPVNLAYTTAIPGAANVTAQWIYGYFASTQVIKPSTICRVTLGETTQSDASTNRFVLREVSWDTDANSVALLPWNGTGTKTYFDGSNWTDSPLGTSMFGHGLLLDPAGEYGSPPVGQVVGARSIGTY
jgi:hypothetical protein